ncbi:MAG TPA: glutamate synthase large subunit, partial [Armatimonadota bacterium]|nr:glutamate synthase large subunit [Armatimonadota bacterium]
ASIAFTDGSVVGAVLDRNGLRPSRSYVTSDDMIVMASEVGVLDIPTEKIIKKGRLQPGRMFLVDTVQGKIITDEEIKHQIASEHPYREWLDANLVDLETLPGKADQHEYDEANVLQREHAFGYTHEDMRKVMGPMATNGVEPVGSMGVDSPLAVLSDQPQLLYNYFKQLFAQVTNPPIDSIREEIVTAMGTAIGPERNLLDPEPESCRQINLHSPILSNDEMAKLHNLDIPGFKSVTLPILFDPTSGGKGLEAAMTDLSHKADDAIADGANIIILSDRAIDATHAPIPALLAVAGLHHHLIREGTRTKIGLVLESGEPREVHHFALLIGYGASAVNPYMAYDVLDDMVHQGLLPDTTIEKAQAKYIKAASKGVVKTMSKMGISTVQSYHGAQIFEALGIRQSVISKYFTWTASRIEGIGLDEIAKEVKMRHDRAFPQQSGASTVLDVGGFYQWRKDGEYHLYNPQTIYKIQQACRRGDYGLYQEFADFINNQTTKLCTLRGLFDLKTTAEPIPIDEVESVESICRRFKTGAMSFGSISKEAHEAMAIAMNRIGGRSNTGEGGEDPARFVPDANGDSRCSAIKQVASGRFGVTSEYLVNAKEIQIKMAQGAKPGEGGQLPGRKVYPWVARVRHSTPGVGLISPPPHHDIYSIEDLAELIHDLKNANQQARISVKLVSEVGVGTIAAGVAKAHADVVLISGYDGGTGASPRSSVRHAGLPWELGLAETHQTLLLNNLRSRIIIETDGKLLTGRDVVVAALLGAEEYGFATTPLISLGCVMMRVCQQDTCPAGIATQNPKLRSCFQGDPQHVVNFMRFIAQDVREWMAKLGFRTIDEMIGRTDKIEMRAAIDHWKAKGLDLSPILYQPDVPASIGRYCQIEQNHGLDNALDNQVLLDLCKPALERGEKVTASLPIKNTNRVVGTILGSEISKRFGGSGLPTDTITLNFSGSAGQSFGAFIPHGLSLRLEGDANDYLGKGLSGGIITVVPPTDAPFTPEENIIIGNVAFYGATGGEAYIRGLAGERFCVRNSGVNAVVEGVGDHGCEYMTGGRVVVLGPTGRNFAAGMSGGIAYVLDTDGTFASSRCNKQMVDLDTLNDEDEIAFVRSIIESHAEHTGSTVAQDVLDHWDASVEKIVKVMPKDYKRALSALARVIEKGLDGDIAVMAAFEANKRDLARVSGN